MVISVGKALSTLSTATESDAVCAFRQSRWMEKFTEAGVTSDFEQAFKLARGTQCLSDAACYYCSFGRKDDVKIVSEALRSAPLIVQEPARHAELQNAPFLVTLRHNKLELRSRCKGHGSFAEWTRRQRFYFCNLRLPEAATDGKFFLDNATFLRPLSAFNLPIK